MLIALQVIVTPLLSRTRIPYFIDGQRLIIGIAMDQLRPAALASGNAGAGGIPGQVLFGGRGALGIPPMPTWGGQDQSVTGHPAAGVAGQRGAAGLRRP